MSIKMVGCTDPLAPPTVALVSLRMFEDYFLLLPSSTMADWVAENGLLS